MEIPSYILCLTQAEAADPSNLGYDFVQANIDRIVQFSDSIIDDVLGGAYDAARTYFVYNDVAYFIHKDYIDVSNARRIYLCKPSLLGVDQVTTTDDSSSDDSTDDSGDTDSGDSGDSGDNDVDAGD